MAPANTHLGRPARQAVGCTTRRLGLDAIRQGLSRFVVAMPGATRRRPSNHQEVVHIGPPAAQGSACQKPPAVAP